MAVVVGADVPITTGIGHAATFAAGTDVRMGTKIVVVAG